MADILIQHLKQKGGEHSSLAMLVNQWGFDEQLIPKALQTVGSLFPHYSRHDESHSKQILINIERLLGDNINLLTATDTWLLLEAAYWHDIGMVVPQQDLEKALLQPEFQQYIDVICNSPNHELFRFAKSFNPRDVSKCFSGADTPMEAVDKFRQVMAEWFRQRHATRSEAIIQAPWSSVGISSPRTELIPARLFKLLGRICEMHGLPFVELLSPSGLPFKEAGLAQEDCHPRFVACLLRMGDLLDLDDNRFCPVMQRIAGENRSRTSKAHEDKHASIRHLRIDRERIEISAECETIDGYLETFKWFDWLKQEIQDQMANWQDIVPNRDLGLLPTLGAISVRLSGEQQILKEGQRPQFGVDSASAIGLLQGNNIYTTKFACVRELLQNAIDATLLRLWLIEKKEMCPGDWESPFSEHAREVLNSAPVRIELAEMPCVPEVPEETAWTLTIIDQGTGISQTDLAYMLRIGGSQRNMQRQHKINTMPEWMKPSGAFGIGIQSAFLIADKITLTTKSLFTNETLEVEMHSPTGSKEGLVLIKVLEDDIARPYGTTVKIVIQLDTFAKSWSISLGNDNSMASLFVQSMDPVLDRSFPYDAAQLADQIQIFAGQSPLKIKATLATADKDFDLTPETVSVNGASDEWRFVRTKNSQQVAIRYQPRGTGSRGHPHGSLAMWYRGQPFKYEGLSFPYVHVDINLMSGTAGAWLAANRDNAASNAEDAMNETILAALEQMVRQDLENRSSCKLLSNESRPAYSLFLEGMALRYGEPWVALAKEIVGCWLDLDCLLGAEKFRDYFSKESWILSERPSHGEPAVDEGACDLQVGESWGSILLSIILNEWLKDDNRTVQILEPAQTLVAPSSSSGAPESPENVMTRELQRAATYRLRYQLKKEPQPAYTLKALATRLVGVTHEVHGNRRFILNCNEERSHLFLKKATKVRASHLFLVSPRNANVVLLPFLYRYSNQGPQIQCTPEQLDALCRWVQPRLVTESAISEIRKDYEGLIKYIDDSVMRPSLYWEFWRRARRLD